MVFPTLYEGFGLTPLEAMASGTPVIAMPVSSVPEVCGDCALYPDGHSPRALARAMEQMASDEELRGDLQDRGRTRVELFRWERTARQTYDSYRRAVLHPSARTLDMRHRLLPAILSWPDAMQRLQDHQHHAAHHPIATLQTLGIKQSWRSLNSAVQRRISREIKRLASMRRAPRHDLRGPETLPIHQVNGSHQEPAHRSEEPVRSVLMQLPRPIITQVTGMGMDLYFSIFDEHIARGGHERGPDVVRLLTADYSTSAPPALVLRRSACVEPVTILKN